MEHCSDFEAKLSELMDQELSKVEYHSLLEHIAKCMNCREVFLDMSVLKARIGEFDNLETEDFAPADQIWEKIAAQTGFQKTSLRKYWRFWPIIPGIAALMLFIFFGLGIQSVFSPAQEPESSFAATLEERSGEMTERHFVKIVQELIQSERKYQFEMLRVMKEIVQIYPGEGSSEGDFSTEENARNDFTRPPEDNIPSIGS